MSAFNEMLEKAGQTVGDLASQVSSSQTFRNIIPTASDFSKELSTVINSNKAIKAKYVDVSKEIGAFKKIFHTLPEEETEKVMHEISEAFKKSNYGEESIPIISDIMKKNNIDSAEALAKNMHKSVSNAIENTPVDGAATIPNFLNNPLLFGKTYFNNPDQTIKKQRIAAVAGTYAGVSAGARYLSGGNLTHDEYGQKDIAGIPFI